MTASTPPIAPNTIDPEDLTTSRSPAGPELSLDPLDWQRFRDLAHRALDDALDYQRDVRSKPVWRPVPAETEALLAGSAPRKGAGAEAVVRDMVDHVVAYPAGHGHPRFWGWVCGTGTPTGMLADMLAASVNASSGTFNDAPSRLEDQLLRWMRDLFGFPEGTSGLVTSGGSVANLVGLTVARDAVLGDDVRRFGLASLGGLPVIYASRQAHSSIHKAMQLLGLGLESLRLVPVDDQYRMRVDALTSMIDEDRLSGMTPVAVVASAGTVNTGAIDDLPAIAEVTHDRDLWLHVDGAIGALAAMSPALKARMPGMELADSLAFDFHKWLYVPYEAGCVLIRDGEQHRRSFSVSASYLQPPARGIGARPDSTNMRGPQLSRGFKALKVWAQIREHGVQKLGQMQEQNVEQAAYLARLVEAQEHLELMAPVALNIVCFRFNSPAVEAEKLNGLNAELLMRLQERGIAAPSSTNLAGRFVLRVAITNQRSRREDFELLVRHAVELGRSLI